MDIKKKFSKALLRRNQPPEQHDPGAQHEGPNLGDGNVAQAYSPPQDQPARGPEPASVPSTSMNSIVSSYLAQSDTPAPQESLPGPEPEQTANQVVATSTPLPVDPVEKDSSSEQQDDSTPAEDDDLMNIFAQDTTENEALRALCAGLAEIDVQTLSEECRDVAALLAKNRRR